MAGSTWGRLSPFHPVPGSQFLELGTFDSQIPSWGWDGEVLRKHRRASHSASGLEVKASG